MTFQSPQALLLLLFIPVAVFYRRAGGKSRGTEFSSLSFLKLKKLSIRERFSSLPFILSVVALVVLIFALARPANGYEVIREVRRGIAINMVLDRSSSMGTPVKADGSRTRLDAVKQVFTDFVSGNSDDLEGCPDDLIGLITFGRYGETLAPLTLSHKTLVDFTDTIQLIDNREEDGTSIGDAISLAVARLVETEKKNRSSEYKIESKIIILLTDGQNNSGTITPVDAAYLAKQWDVKIYTIGFGAGYYRNAFGLVRKIPEGYGIDGEMMGKMAEITGGAYFSADSEESLREIYSEIDKLEKSGYESLSYKNYREAFIPFAAAGFGFLFLSFILSATFFRRIP